MSQIGYYRLKTTATDGRVVKIYVNGVEAGSAIIKALPFCSGDRLVKYLDHTGQYRFYTFNKFYEVKDTPQAIGTTNKFITSILTGQSSDQNIGYRNERKLSLTTDATAEQLAMLSDLFLSPRVYLYIGDGVGDTLKDWLEVTITSNTPIKRRKAIGGRVDAVITLPDHYTIKQI